EERDAQQRRKERAQPLEEIGLEERRAAAGRAVARVEIDRAHPAGQIAARRDLEDSLDRAAIARRPARLIARPCRCDVRPPATIHGALDTCQILSASSRVS